MAPLKGERRFKLIFRVHLDLMIQVQCTKYHWPTHLIQRVLKLGDRILLIKYIIILLAEFYHESVLIFVSYWLRSFD